MFGRARTSLALNSEVSAWEEVTRWVWFWPSRLDQGDRDLADGGERRGQGERERPEQAAAANAATPSAPSAIRRPTGGRAGYVRPPHAGGGRRGRGGRGRAGAASRAGRITPSHEQQPGVGQQERDAHQPRSADGGEREYGRVLPLGRAVEAPRPAQPLIGPDPLRDQPGSSAPRSAPRARPGHDTGGLQQAVDRDANAPTCSRRPRRSAPRPARSPASSTAGSRSSTRRRTTSLGQGFPWWWRRG